MEKSEPSLDDVYDLVQPEFEYLDKKIGDRNNRCMAIGQVPQLERDLYLIHDVVCITSNAGMLAWIHYHHDEIGWIPAAKEAFTRIGHEQISQGLEECLETYHKKRGSLTHRDDASASGYIFEHEQDIMVSLYKYLVANGFLFPHFGK